MGIDELIESVSVFDAQNFVRVDNIKPTPKLPYQVPAIAREITKGIESPKVKAYAIYNWISENIKYNRIANENFDEECSVVYSLKKKAGTCYSMTRLYVALAKSIGLDARIVKVIVDRDGKEIGSPGHVCAMVDYVTSHQLYDPAYEDSDAKHKEIKYHSREDTNQELIEDILKPYQHAVKLMEEKQDNKTLLKFCDALLSIFPDQTYFKLKKEDALVKAGLKNLEKGQLDFAEVCFVEATKLNPKNSNLLNTLGSARALKNGGVKK